MVNETVTVAVFPAESVTISVAVLFPGSGRGAGDPSIRRKAQAVGQACRKLAIRLALARTAAELTKVQVYPVPDPPVAVSCTL